jgi:preprotein translocase subunit YajC
VDLLIIILAGFAVMWLVIVLPQRRRASAHERMVSAVRVDDAIVTAGGLHGRVTRIGDDDLGVEVAPGVEVRLARRAVAAVLPDDDGARSDRERSTEEIPG